MAMVNPSNLLPLVVGVLIAACAADPAELDPIPAPDDVGFAPADALRTGSGLAYRVLAQGGGELTPGPVDRVNVHYTGWTTDGVMFDSSVQRGVTATFGVNQVIQGWTEGLQLMTEGDEFRLWIPQDLAYRGQSGRPSGMLVFDVELIKVFPEG
jgi:FKBP-type peptidyl-prolyl cis-trans isomerase